MDIVDVDEIEEVVAELLHAVIYAVVALHWRENRCCASNG